MDRHREVLDTALRIIVDEGLAALTMQGLADRMEWSIGSLYRSFPSKGALIAELQREGLDVVNTSLQLSQSHIDRFLAERGITDPLMVALTRVVGACRFWIGAESMFPQEVELGRRLFTDPGQTMDEQEGARVVPAALRLLDQARGTLDSAVAAGALSEAPNLDRAVILVAGTTGVLMTSKLDRWDDVMFDTVRLSSTMVRDLLLGWGAPEAELDEAHALMAELHDAGRLIPRVGI
jgi:AcrR family transcriptional regulator